MRENNADPLALFTSYEQFSEEINFLKYHFLLDFNTKKEVFSNKYDTSDELLYSIFQSIDSLPPHLNYKLEYNLFGGNFDVNETKHEQYKKRLFQDTCINCLYTVISLLFSNGNIDSKKPATISKYLLISDEKNLFSTYGYFTYKLLSDNYKNFSSLTNHIESQFVKNTLYGGNWYSQNTYSNAIDRKFIKKMDSINDFLCWILDINKYYKNANNIPLHIFDLIEQFQKNNTFFTQASLEKKGFREKNLSNLRYEKLITAYHNISNVTSLHTFLNPRHDTTSYELLFSEKAKKIKCTLEEALKLDHLLLQFQLERYFNCNLFNHLAQQKNLLKSIDYDLLIKFTKLPNTFSRNELVNWAMQNYGSDTIYSNYQDLNFDTHNELLQAYQQGIEKQRRITEITNKTTWEANTEFAIDYLSTIYFPFREKYFFVCLYKYIEKFFSNNELSYAEILYEMLYHLATYCIEIYDNIFNSYSTHDFVFEEYLKDKDFYLEMLTRLMHYKHFESMSTPHFSRSYFLGSDSKQTSKDTITSSIKFLRLYQILSNIK